MKLAVLVVLLATVLATPAFTVQYALTDLGYGEALAINNNGWVTGEMADSNPDLSRFPFIRKPDGAILALPIQGVGRGINDNNEVVGYGGWNNGSGIDWKVDEYDWSDWVYFNLAVGSAHPLAINSLGQIVGYSKVNDGTHYDSVLWKSLLEPEVIGDLGGAGSWAYAINNAGVVVGEAQNSENQSRAYIWTREARTQVLSGINSTSAAWGINDSGQVVGEYDVDGSRRPFLWENGMVQNLGTLSTGSQAWASDINNLGVVVGGSEYVRESSVEHAYVWTQSGGMVDLTPGLEGSSWAVAINDNGWIVGSFQDSDQRQHIALWKPVPEPTSLLALGAGVATLTTLKRRKKR